MKAAFLIRCSTKNQDLSRQTRDLTRLATSKGYEYDLENLVYGEKITGKDDVTKRNRESIDRLLKGAKEQKFDVVLVSEVSRMSRDPASGRVYIRLLSNMGIPVYFKDIDLWTFEPNTVPNEAKIKANEMIIGAAFDAAWKYLKSMKTQIASARRNQLDNGAISVGKPYFGYQNRGGKDKLTKTQWVVNEVEAEIVLATFEEYVKEGATLKSTALAITDRYGETLNRKFSLGTIEHILTYEPYHTGINKINLTDPDSGEVEVYDVEVPKLVPSELYEEASRKRNEKRNNREPYPTQSTYLLSRLVKCPQCGYTMTPKPKSNKEGKCGNGCFRMINGKKALSWICMAGINNLTDCTSRLSVANEKLEPIIWELVKKELINFANLNNEEREEKVRDIESQIELQNYNKLNYDKEIAKLNKRIATAYQFSLNAYEMAGDNEEMKSMAMEEFNKTAKAHRKDIATYENSKESAIAEIERLTILKTYYSQPTLPTDIIEKAEANPVEQRNLIKELITKIVPYKITTFEKYVKEKGRGAFKNKMIVKNGAVLLEVTTINGIYNIFYNANGRENVRYAYYMSGVYSNYQNGANKYPAFPEGEYFVINYPDMLLPQLGINEADEEAKLEAIANGEYVDEAPAMEFNEPYTTATINQFVELAKANNWVLEYQYKPDIPES